MVKHGEVVFVSESWDRLTAVLRLIITESTSTPIHLVSLLQLPQMLSGPPMMEFGSQLQDPSVPGRLSWALVKRFSAGTSRRESF